MKYVHGGDIYTYKNMLDFSANINPLGPSPNVIEAAKRGVENSNVYPDSRCGRLRAELANKISLPADYFLAGNGAADLLFSLVLAEKPRHALLPVPAFSEYEQALKTMGCKIKYKTLCAENNFRITEDLLDEIVPEIDIIFLCSPSNPAGQLIEKKVLEPVIQKCQKNNIRLVVDECFFDFVSDMPYCLTDLTKEYPCLFLLRAFTKMHAVPGLRIGYCICSDKALLQRMENVRQPWSVSVPAQEAGIAALNETRREEQTRSLILEERDRLERKLAQLGFRVVPSAANFILFNGKAGLAEKAREYKILIRDCSNYSGLGKGWYRVAVRLRKENEHLLKVLKKIVEKEET